MRQVCNVSWAIQVENMDDAEYRKWERELRADPGRKVSHGGMDLMRLMQVQAAKRSR